MLMCLQLIPNSLGCIKYIQGQFACYMIKACFPPFVVFQTSPQIERHYRFAMDGKNCPVDYK